MLIKYSTDAVITAIECFIDEFGDNVHVIGYDEFTYVFAFYESLLKLKDKPSYVYLDHEDLALFGIWL